MAGNNEIKLYVVIDPKISLWAAIKLRIAGGEAAKAFWEALAERISEK